MSSSLTTLLTPDLLKQLAGDRSYQRGEDYFRLGRVRSRTEHEGAIAATVKGANLYTVELWLEAGQNRGQKTEQLGYQCDCPVGIDGWFCKHCVAVGLAWLAQPSDTTTGQQKATSATTTMRDVQLYLEQQEQADLVKLVLDRAMQDPDWREQLLLKVAAVQLKS